MANSHRILDGITTLHTQYDILVMGGKGVGKTSLIYKFLNRTPPENHEANDELHAKMLDLQYQQSSSASSVSSAFEEITILDASSSGESYASSKSQQVRNAHTVLFVYNIANRDSFEALEYMMEGVMVMRSDQPPPFAVVALELENLSEYQVLDYEGAELASRFGAVGFFEVSMRYEDEVKHVFQVLIDQALQIKNSGRRSGLDEQLFQAHGLEQSQIPQPFTVQNSSDDKEVFSGTMSKNESSTATTPAEPVSVSPSSLKFTTTKDPHTSSYISLEDKPNTPKPSTSMNKRTTSRSDETKSQSGCCIIM